MSLFKLKGRANYNGCVQEKFEVVVESDDPNFKAYSNRQQDAVKKLHPDWQSITVDYAEKLS